MATQLTPFEVPYAGLTGALADITDAATAAGNWFICKHPSRTFILLYNANAAARTMTIIGQKTSPPTDAVTSPPYTIAIGNVTAQYLLAPVSEYEIDEAGKVHLTYDAVVNLEVGVIVVGED